MIWLDLVIFVLVVFLVVPLFFRESSSATDLWREFRFPWWKWVENPARAYRRYLALSREGVYCRGCYLTVPPRMLKSAGWHDGVVEVGPRPFRSYDSWPAFWCCPCGTGRIERGATHLFQNLHFVGGPRW